MSASPGYPPYASPRPPARPWWKGPIGVLAALVAVAALGFGAFSLVTGRQDTIAGYGTAAGGGNGGGGGGGGGGGSGSGKPIGTAQDVTMSDVTATITVLDVEDDAPYDPSDAPDRGIKYVAVQVLIVNQSAKDPFETLAGLATKLTDTTGEQYEPRSGTSTIGPDLVSTSLGPKDARRGWITYEIPDDAKPKLMQWDVDEPQAVWDLTAKPVDPGKLTAPSAPLVAKGAPAKARELTGVPFELTVTQVVDPTALKIGAEDDPDQRRIGVQLTVRNIGTPLLVTLPFDELYLVDTKGQEFYASSQLITAGENLPGVLTVAVDGSVTGFVSFVLPKDSVPLKLTARDYFDFDGRPLSMTVGAKSR